MNEKTKLGLIALSLVAVLLVAGCAGAAPEGANDTGETGESDTGGQVDTGGEGTAETGGTTFATALSAGESYKCEISAKNLEELDEMTVWVKEGNMRIDYLTTEGKEFGQITKEDTTWWWDPQEKTGIKRTVTSEDTSSEGGTGEESSGYSTEDLKSDYEWECNPTSVSDSKFNPPSDVEFTDMGNLQDLADTYG